MLTQTCRLSLARVACGYGICRQRLGFLVFEFAEAFQGRRAPWYLRGLIREPLRKIEVVLLQDVEHRFLGEPAMVLGKQSMHVCELFVGHGHCAFAAIPEYTAIY